MWHLSLLHWRADYSLRKILIIGISMWKTSHIWLPHTQDLSTLDFYLWDSSKDNWFVNMPTTIDEHKPKILHHITAITLFNMYAILSIQTQTPSLHGARSEPLWTLTLETLFIHFASYCYFQSIIHIVSYRVTQKKVHHQKLRNFVNFKAFVSIFQV